MRIRSALLATTLLGSAFAAAASAQTAPPIDGVYISAGAGYNLLQDEHLRPGPSNGGGDGIRQHTRYRFGDGYDAVAAVGYGFGNGLRAEIEGHYLNNDVNNYVRTAIASSTTGHTESYGGLANVLYDFNLSNFGISGIPVTPYLGVGAGYMWTHLSPLSSVFNDGTVLRTGGTNGSVAYQGIAGISYDIAALPGLAVTAEYRYLGQLNQDAYQATYYRGPGVISKGNAKFDDQHNHSIMVGLRYAFNTAPPPPPPAPAPIATPPVAPARTYLVFFDWDRADLTERARQIIHEAANASTHVQTTRIEVNGYTDLSGTAAYNQGLSVRRAKSVEAELVRDGVPRGSIGIHGYGESNPLVPTAQGVREPQNRRVEIILH
ncbi:MAG: OmpA family protein [Janthinobacterium lividum]